MLSKPKLIGATVAVTAAATAAVMIGSQVYGSGDPSPPTFSAAATAQDAADPAVATDTGEYGGTGEQGGTGQHGTSGEHGGSGGQGAPAGSGDVVVTPVAGAPMDQAMEHLTDAPSPARTNTVARQSRRAVFLAATLNGRNEVPTADGAKVGDRNGRAVQVIRIQGNQISFATAWKGIAPPTASHIHEGVAGVNGAVKVPFFGTALPNGVSAVTGSVTVTDTALLDDLARNPDKYYANLHTAQFPGGAVRAQFRRLNRPVDLDRVLDFGKLVALGSGKQEVPVAGGPAVGDPDGRSIGFVWAKAGRVDFSLRWSKIDPPTLGHLHQGRAGANGAVVVPLFNAPDGLPPTINGVAGTTAGLDRKLTDTIGRVPADFYTNLHTAALPGGSVRGQLARLRIKH